MKDKEKTPSKLGRPLKDETMDVALSFKLPLALRDAAQVKSRNTGIAISFVLRKALEEWLEGEGNSNDEKDKSTRTDKFAYS